MTLNISPPVPLGRRVHTPLFSVSGIDLLDVAGAKSPVTVLERIPGGGSSVSAHPHAGFFGGDLVSARLPRRPPQPGLPGARSADRARRDGLDGSGRGVLHHELPADAGLAPHGLQFLVNASAQAKLNPPNIFWVQGTEVPVLAVLAGKPFASWRATSPASALPATERTLHPA